MLPTLQRVPKTPADWRQFSWDHRDSHGRIRNAARAKLNVNLTDYVIDPINPNGFDQFLQNNANLHTEMNQALGQDSNNLLDVDFTDEEKLAEWISDHYTEHLNAEQKLGL